MKLAMGKASLDEIKEAITASMRDLAYQRENINKAISPEFDFDTGE